jgi:ribosomal protein S18 acetylase RimI-like enzyme
MTFDRRLQRYLRRSAARGRDAVGAGPFTAFFKPGDPMRFLNYAIPEERARVTAADVDALAEPFEARGRLPRLEYVESEAPGLAQALEAGGYACEARLDLMTCTPETLLSPPRPAGLRLERVDASSPPETVRTLVRTQRAAFGEPGEGDGPVGASVGMLATLDGEPAAAGLFTAPEDGLTEIAGLGTLEPFRRRGIAAALTAALAGTAFSGGVQIAFLTPGDDDTRRVYERAGFAARSIVLAYARA